MPRFFSVVLSLLVLFLAPSVSSALTSQATDRASPPGHEISIATGDGTEIVATQYPASGDTLIIWIISSYSPTERMFQTSYALADRGYEIWQVDFSESLFQPKSSNFMRNLDAQYVADTIVSAHKQTDKKIVLMARAYGAIPLLRGATLWQLQHPTESYLSGGILFSPDFFTAIPDLGLDPDYLPITSQSTIPLMIYQSGRRGTAWQLPRLLETLRTTNENIYFKVMSEVSGVFYQADVEPATITMLNRLPDEIPGIIKLLQNSKVKPPPRYKQAATVHRARLNSDLKPFSGKNAPPQFALKDIYDRTSTLGNLEGGITLVNFWATWCTPCLEEIPSLNRLAQKMKDKPFRLISINYAEPKEQVSNFLKRVNVEFPVLLDYNGEISAQWNVIAFPSTFVIGPDGKIHYGINAAIAWDDPKIISRLESLMDQ